MDEFMARHAEWMRQWAAAQALAAEQQCGADDPRILAITKPVFSEALALMAPMTPAQRAKAFEALFLQTAELATQLYVIGLGFL